MIVCRVCGNQNANTDEFCTSCNRYLKYYGDVVPDPAPPSPPPVAVPPSTPELEPDFVDRMKHAVGLDRPKSEGAPPAGGVPTPPAPISSGTGAAAIDAPGYAPAAKMADPAIPAAVVPRAPETPIARVPESVEPGPEIPRPGPKTGRAIAPQVQPGDVICARCGAGNSPDRHFCQRCGANLKATPALVVKTPWWQRLFPARSAPAAGTRPATGPVERAWGTALFRVIAAGVIAVIVLVYLVVPPVHTRVNNTVASLYATAHRHFAPNTFPVRPSDAKASSELPTHPARLSIDLVTETYWAANTATDKQPWLRLSFGGPVDFDAALITSGAANDYATLARPKEVQIVFSDKTSVHLTLKDDPKPTSYDASAHHVTYAEIHILSVYPSAQSPDVAINEVEFFKTQ